MSQTPYNRALDLLAARPYSVKGLHRKLVQKGATGPEADEVVERLLANGLLDDARYALAFARSKLVSSGSAVRRVKQELARKGVASDVATEAISHIIADEELDTRASLEKVARKKLAQMGDLPALTLRRRLYSFLARRGYEMEEIQSVVSSMLSER